MTYRKEVVLKMIELDNGNVAIGYLFPKLRIWNLDTKEKVKELNGHSHSVTSLIQLIDGHLASGSCDATIKIWNYTDGSLKQTLHHDKHCIMELTCLKKQPLLVSSTLDGDITIWNLTRGRILFFKTFAEQSTGIQSLALLKDGSNNLIATGSFTGVINIWNLDTGIVRGQLFGHVDDVGTLCYLGDVYLASGSKDFKIKIWNYEAGQELRQLTGHTNWLTSILMLDNGHLASAAQDGLINIWNYTSGRLVDTYFNEVYPNYRFASLSLLKNGNLASASDDGFAKIWYSLDKYNSSFKLKKTHFSGRKNKPNQPELVATINFKHPIIRLLLMKDQEHLLIAGASSIITIWNVKTKANAKQLTGHLNNVVNLAELTKQIVVSSAGSVINVWNFTNTRLLRNLTHIYYQTVNGLLPLASEKLVIAFETILQIWNTSNGESLAVFNSQKINIVSIALLSSQILASGHFSEGIFIWNLTSGKVIQTINLQFDNYLLHMQFFENNSLAIGQSDFSIKIINVTTRMFTCSLVGHQERVVNIVKLTNDRLSSASYDGSVKIWNYKNASLIKTLRSHSDYVCALVLLKNLNLLSGSVDGTVKEWNVKLLIGNQSVLPEIEYGEYPRGSNLCSKILVWLPNIYSALEWNIKFVQIRLN
jgi:WD40 repeat protein